MPAFAEIVDHNASNVRKTREGSVFVGGMDLTVPTRLTDASTGLPVDLAALGWVDLGLLSEDGATVSKEISNSQTTAWQSATPVRDDIVSSSTSLSVVARESRRSVIEAYSMRDLSELDTLAGGAIVFDEAVTPDPPYARVLAIGVDSGQIVAKCFPRARVSSVGDWSLSKSDDGVQYEITWTAFEDPELKTAIRHYYEGLNTAALAAAGWKAVGA